jgi:hypothetical protein
MLPFEADQFDLVRISGIGLYVPEDQVSRMDILLLFLQLLTPCSGNSFLRYQPS